MLRVTEPLFNFSFRNFLILYSVSPDKSKYLVCNSKYLELKDNDVLPLSIEGYVNLNWVLMDFINVVIHIFLPEYRSFYDLERLWGDADSYLIEDKKPNQG